MHFQVQDCQCCTLFEFTGSLMSSSYIHVHNTWDTNNQSRCENKLNVRTQSCYGVVCWTELNWTLRGERTAPGDSPDGPALLLLLSLYSQVSNIVTELGACSGRPDPGRWWWWCVMLSDVKEMECKLFLWRVETTGGSVMGWRTIEVVRTFMRRSFFHFEDLICLQLIILKMSLSWPSFIFPLHMFNFRNICTCGSQCFLPEFNVLTIVRVKVGQTHLWWLAVANGCSPGRTKIMPWRSEWWARPDNNLPRHHSRAAAPCLVVSGFTFHCH